MWATLILGASIGFFGSFHCVAMCGPIAAYIHNSTSLKSSVVLYNLGRVLTYITLGVLLALVGDGFELFGLQRWISVVAGVFVLIVVLFPVVQRKYSYLASTFTPLNKLKHQLTKATKEGKMLPYLFIGMLNGLLPCGVVYLALATSLSTANMSSAAMLMLGFGIGTWPLMLMVGFSVKFFGKTGRLRLNYVVPALSVLIGVLLIMRGLALDIPYVSPMLSKIGPDYGFASCAKP
ncbi:sulfite exporter TauE/SafE family protein [Fulvivirga lutimaris]|uniref:sulfite exporter TauE/SafE family protein n=1 Tax=Fulvivirga lutimaris TaxID=1819566 RepID=UPI0012BB6FF3|nr:sulfite exporter TauE/SafE family protein [Fulvivirga lutimaris]MTI38393.1 sulfite exporter TauE/SafE family protein [Fulvivirga lutimaris]